MARISRLRPWHRPDPRGPRVLTESEWLSRRQVLRALGYGGLSAGIAACSTSFADDDAPAVDDEPAAPAGYAPSERWVPSWAPPGEAEHWPPQRNAAYDPGRILTPEGVAATHNNFYEFYPYGARDLTRYTGDFEGRPWTVAVGGLVEEEFELDLDELGKLAPLEERYYRFRCVEAWSMTVPWVGYPLSALIERCRPTSEARYVRFVSFHDPEVAPGFARASHYPWPYYEGLRLDEAMNPLALCTLGIFGHALPTQHGAPFRVIVPWKYGYKSPKSIVRLEFTAEQPSTFWYDLQPSEYPFLSNVEPEVPHPRWSQADERDIATGDRRPTLLYNGYADEVGALYE